MTEEEIAKIAYAQIIKAIEEVREDYVEHFDLGFPSTVEVNGTIYRFSKIPNISPIDNPN
jgi:hypothetical protein